MRMYERLSQFYDPGWGEFAEQYVGLIRLLLEEHNIKRGRIMDMPAEQALWQ